MDQDRSHQEPSAAYKGYNVYDRHFHKVGKVDDLFVDEYDRPEYIGVKMGLLGTSSTLIPMELVRINDLRNLVEVAADEETIKHAPTFHDDKDITPDYEHGVHGYFGLERPQAERERSAYGGYYASDPHSDEELRRSVDTEFGQRADPLAGTHRPDEPARETGLDMPLESTGRGEAGAGERLPQDESAETSEDLLDADAATREGGDRREEIEVQGGAEGDREVRVFKRTRPTTR